MTITRFLFHPIWIVLMAAVLITMFFTAYPTRMAPSNTISSVQSAANNPKLGKTSGDGTAEGGIDFTFLFTAAIIEGEPGCYFTSTWNRSNDIAHWFKKPCEDLDVNEIIEALKDKLRYEHWIKALRLALGGAP